MRKLLLFGGAIIGGLFLIGSGSASAATSEPESEPAGGEPPPSEPPFSPDPAREQAECHAAAKDRPTEHDGRTRGATQALFRWLGWVAYRKAYPVGPAEPAPGGEWATALGRITSCVQVRLAQADVGGIVLQPKPDDPPPPPDNTPPVSATPKPNSYYPIKGGDNLFAVTSAAYGTQFAANLAAAKKVNDAAYNKRFHVDAPAGEKQWWSKRISFLPKFGTFEAQQSDPNGSKGGQFAVIWLPPADEVL